MLLLMLQMTKLAQGGGVCGAISFSAAQGNNKNDALTQYIQSHFQGGTQPGQAIITPSFHLRQSEGVQFVIHAVGPIYKDYADKKIATQLLKNAYINSLNLAEKKGLESIAFPFISSAAFGYPKPEAATIALNTVKEYAIQNPKSIIANVFFVLFLPEDFGYIQKRASKNHG